ncbi:MAG: glycosyltransferase family 2 protein [Bacteroidaceae bacterium]|nr:glycosyltransferase family 2 protein [Bacteroidaceae bacterium]
MKISIIIVNFNVKTYLSQCIDSVKRSIEGLDGEILVVDNNSNDGSVEWIQQRFQNIKVILNHSNTGFAKANNQAIRLAKGEYILLLNPDTIIGENTLREVIQVMDQNPDVGGAGVRMLNSNGSFALESRRGIPTPFTAFCKMSGLGKLFPKSKSLGHYYLQYLDSNLITDIEIISGACMFIRRSTLQQVGMLDETFFMYGEDIDLSYRLLKTGMRNIYVPVNILHYKGESTKKGAYKYVNAFYQAMLIFYKKNFGSQGFWLSIPIKSAIYTKGLLEYIWLNCRKLTDRHDSLYFMRQKQFLLLGKGENLKKMIEKCSNNNIIYQSVSITEEIIKHGHIAIEDSISNYDCIVYDMNLFSYEVMLEAFRITGNNKTSPMIATYQSDADVIITGSLIF